MAEMAHVVDNIAIANESEANSMTDVEHEIMTKVKNIFKSKQKVGCTGCGYCMPCPAGVDIPGNFQIYNKAHLLNEFYTNKIHYSLLSGKEQACHCVECGKCEQH